MDQKPWLWRKKSTEKIILATDKLNQSQKDNDQETIAADNGELENELKILSNTKEELVKKHAKIAQEAVAGREKAEAEAIALKKELDEALQQRFVYEERLTHLDAALKECMQQLRFVREEKEQRIHDAVMKASKEFEKSHKTFEEQLGESSKSLTKLSVENTNLNKALLAKEKVIDDLNKQRAQKETDFNALLTRLESTEKDNASLKYEVRVLEKELEIRNEEREFNRRTAEASQKQHLESVKKIAKLESECQRLRLLVRKRLPGPAALAKMKNEVEMLGRESIEMRRKKLTTSPTGSGLEYSAVDSYLDSPSRRINPLMEQLYTMEEENKALKEALNKKKSELQFARVMYARTASKLSDVESQLEESSRNLVNNESTMNSIMSQEISLASMSDVGSDDKASCAESWASALLSELEHFRNGQLRKSLSRKTVASSEINLMDDFVEMEKLALVSVDKVSGSSHVSSDEANGIVKDSQMGSSGNSLEVCKEIVPIPDSQSDSSILNTEMKSPNPFLGKLPAWLQDLVKVVLDQSRATHRNPDEILEDIRKALAFMSSPNTGDTFDEREVSDHPNSSEPSCISGYISRKPSNDSSKKEFSHGDTDLDICSVEKSNQQFQPDLSKSICRIIELIEGISLVSQDYNIPEALSKERNFFSYKHSETPSGYTVRVFQWKTSELTAVLQQFLHACYNLLNGKADLNKFTEELTSALDWIINHCFSLQDVSSMKDAIKTHFEWEESRSGSEAEVGIIGQFAEADKPHLAATNDSNTFSRKEEPIVREDKKLIDELINKEATAKGSEDKRQSTADMSDSFIDQREESEKTIANLQAKLHSLRKTEGNVEGQVEKQQLLNESGDKHLPLTKDELNEACQKFTSQQVESENKSNFHEELESICLDSMTENKIPNSELKHEENKFRTKWEITAASEKLAECQETILNLGKQLKALASPKEASLFDNVISTPTDAITSTSTTVSIPPKKKSISQRSSLLDQMIAEDDAEVNNPGSSKAEENGNPSSFISNKMIQPLGNAGISNGNKQQEDNAAVKSLAIVSSKKQSGSLWKKLLWRKTKGSSKRKPLPFAL